MQKEIDKTGEDMLYLITCALHNQTPDKDKVCGMDLTALYRYARRHTLAAITYDALELIGSSTGEGLRALAKDDTIVSVLTKWKETRDKAKESDVRCSQKEIISIYGCRAYLAYAPERCDFKRPVSKTGNASDGR